MIYKTINGARNTHFALFLECISVNCGACRSDSAIIEQVLTFELKFEESDTNDTWNDMNIY